MFVLIFVFLALLATSSSSAQPGFPRYVQGRWVIADEKPAYEETEEQSQAVEDAVWSNNLMEDVQLVTPSDQDLQTTPDSSATQAQETEEHSQAVEDAVWPNPNNNPMEDVQLVTPSDQDLQTTPDSSAIQAQELDKVEKTAAWKVVLVVSILLVSLVGSVSMAYYYCVWRGGRIHYQAQKEGFS